MRTRGLMWGLALLAVLVLPGRAAAQGALTNGVVHTGAINPVGDLDTWTFTANQGDYVSLRVGEIPVGPGVPDPGFYPYIQLLGTNGAIIASATGNVDAEVSMTTPLTGAYTVRISAYHTGGTGNYNLTLAKAPGGYQTSGGDEGGVLTNGLHHTGAIAVGDIDMWSFDAAKDDTVVVRIGEIARQPDPGFYPYIRIIGTNGAVMNTSVHDVDAEASFRAPLSGTYTVLVSAYHWGGAGDYRITLAKAPGTFQTAQTDEGGSLTNGLRHQGRIILGDIDLWTIDANQNDTVVVRIGEIPVGPGTPDPGFYPYLRVVGPTGAVITTAVSDVDAEVSWRASLKGTYTVYVSAYHWGGTGDYLVGVVQTPGGFQTASGDHGGAMTNGSRSTGRIELGDLDVWTLTATQGHDVAVRVGEIKVPPTVQDPGFYPYVRVIDAQGVVVGTAVNDVDAEVSFNASLSGVYTVIVSAYHWGAKGDYTVSFATDGNFQTSNGDQGGALADGVTQTADIDLGDIDLWSFPSCQGRSVNVTVAEIPRVPDPGFYPYVRVIGPGGTVVASGVNDTASVVTFTAGLTGTYTILTSAYHWGGTGDYTIRVNGVCATPPPTPPTSVNDSYTTTENTPLVVTAPGVMANDSNVTGATVSLVSAVTTGSLTLNANGGFTYTPPNGYTGTATFQYRATNTGGAGNVALVSIAVQAAAKPPVATDDGYSAQQDVPFTQAAPGVLANDVAGTGGALTAFLVTPTSHGGVSLNSNGSFTYTPNVGFSGSDTFRYRVSNANGFSNVATVTIQVTAATTTSAPTNLYAWSIVGNTVTLRWTPPTAGTPSGYVMDGGVAPNAPLVNINTQQPLPVFVFSAPSGSFYVRIRAIVNGVATGPTNEIRVDVNVPVAPSAPAGLTGTVNGGAVALSWRNTFGGGTPRSVILDVNGTLSGSLPLGAAESFVYPAMPGGTYTFSVRAQNAGGTSASSNAVTLSFPGPCTGAPQAPEQFLAFNTGNQLNLLWDPPTSGPAPTHYVLNVTGAVSASVPLNTRGLSLPVPPGSYTFTVAAVNGCGTSSATAPQTVTIP